MKSIYEISDESVKILYVCKRELDEKKKIIINTVIGTILVILLGKTIDRE